MMSTVSQRGTAIVVQVTKPLRLDETNEIEKHLEALIRVGVPEVIVDLTSAPLIDGAGLEWLLDLDARCGQAGGCVRLCGANELCQDILLVTGVEDRLEQFETLAKALAR